MNRAAWLGAVHAFVEEVILRVARCPSTIDAQYQVRISLIQMVDSQPVNLSILAILRNHHVYHVGQHSNK